uniref:UbiC transcription regulator-associated domain-containing protein n=1 Tax=Rhizobium leguminosarum TaxID=384 RepID=A0A179BQE5_RHILE|nr:hypothetical protein A4U53_39960 [Rhizobium leguminosarum]
MVFFDVCVRQRHLKNVSLLFPSRLLSDLVRKWTANRALLELANGGDLVRVQDFGSFVVDRRGYSALFEVRNIAEEIAERGHAYDAFVVVPAQEAASSEVDAALELPTGSAVLHSLIANDVNGDPVQIDDSLVPPTAAPS